METNKTIKLTDEQEAGLLQGIKDELAAYIDQNGRAMLEVFAANYTNWLAENPTTDKAFKWRGGLSVVISPWRSEFGIAIASKHSVSKKLLSEGRVVQLELLKRDEPAAD